MPTVIVSPKYQVVIPKAVRKSLRLRPGRKIQVLAYGDRIELVPERSLKEMRGFIHGIDTTVERDGDGV